MKEFSELLLFILSCLAIPILFFGFYPDPLINTIEVSIEDLIRVYKMNLINPYELMGIDPNKPDLQKLKKTYYNWALMCHPDKGGSKEDMNIIHNAYLYVKKQIDFSDGKEKVWIESLLHPVIQEKLLGDLKSMHLLPTIVIIMPLLSRFEKVGELPSSISAAVLSKKFDKNVNESYAK